MKIKRDFKVKVTPIKTQSLCKICKYDETANNCLNCSCMSCDMHVVGFGCKCLEIEYGKPCRYFERRQKKTNNNIVDSELQTLAKGLERFSNNVREAIIKLGKKLTEGK